MEKGKIGIVGAGLVGASWALVFARAGYAVAIHDRETAAIAAALASCRGWAGQLAERGLLAEPAEAIMARLHPAETLDAAVCGAVYVQESVREDLAIKQETAARIAASLGPEAIAGSSTSGFPASVFTAGLAGRERFLVVHPVNPPHLVPVVEIVPAPWTGRAAVAAARAMMEGIGQKPVLLEREIDGFILNRLQGALLDEALRLYAAGYASIADIDATISHGLGRRWSLIGPFETIDLNSAQGLAGYAHHLAPMYRRIAATRPDADPWSDSVVARAHADRQALLPDSGRAARQAWRDDLLMRMAALIGPA